MNKKNFRLSKHGTWLLKNNKKLFHWGNDNDEIVEYLNVLYEENEQLKQQEKRLYKYFRKCFDNVSEESFRETWEVVKNNG